MNNIGYRKLRSQMLEKFGRKCSYCGTKLYESTQACIEHFYPKSIYPHFANELSNLLIACNTCSMIKRDRFPLDDEGKPLLINPAVEKFSDHIAELDNGYLEGITEKGKQTILVLQLNRPALVEQRVLDVIEMEFCDYRKLSEHETYMTFKTNMRKISRLNAVKLPTSDSNLDSYMAYMLYANSITVLETYLCDRFIAIVQSNKAFLRRFVENFHEYKDEKFSMTELFTIHDGVEDKSINSMKDVLYHNLPKVSGMYRDTFGIHFPQFSEIYKSVMIRHDLVHRGGKTKDGKFHLLNIDSVNSLVSECSNFVEMLESELKAIK